MLSLALLAIGCAWLVGSGHIKAGTAVTIIIIGTVILLVTSCGLIL